MKMKRVVFLTMVVVLLLGTVSVSAAPLSSLAADQPWTAQLLKTGEAGVLNLSTAFVGSDQVPMLSYSRAGLHNIYQAHLATSAVAGNCGPNNTWYCNTWNDSSLAASTVSPMATMKIMDTHLIKWAYSAGSTIRGATIELMNDMSFVGDSWEDLIQISKFGSAVIGVPSLQIRGGHYELAVTIRDSTDLFGHKLVYMRYTGNTPKTSCINSGSVYDCVVIEQSYGNGSMGAPSLQLADDFTVGIAYYRAGQGMKYAYPHTHSALWPSNCGPGGDTWRCITIFAGTETGALGQVVKLAMGKTSSERAIAFTYDDTLIPVTLYHATYVGSGGNCGSDRTIIGGNVNKWQCGDIVGLGASPSYSIDLDPQGYPVIAFDYATSDLAPLYLNVTYPRERVGDPNPGWIVDRVDGVGNTLVATGAQAALSFNSAGLGFIGYLQEEDYVLPDLKIALQHFGTFLPLLVR